MHLKEKKNNNPQKWVRWISFLSPRLSEWEPWGTDGHSDGEYGALQYDSAAKTLQRNIPGRQWKSAQLSCRSDRGGETNALTAATCISSGSKINFAVNGRFKNSKPATLFIVYQLKSKVSILLLPFNKQEFTKWSKSIEMFNLYLH